MSTILGQACVVFVWGLEARAEFSGVFFQLGAKLVQFQSVSHG